MMKSFKRVATFNASKLALQLREDGFDVETSDIEEFLKHIKDDSIELTEQEQEMKSVIDEYADDMLKLVQDVKYIVPKYNYSRNPDGTLIEQPVEQQGNIADYSGYTNYSGAAEGSDKYWAEVAKKYGVGKQVDYLTSHLDKLTEPQLEEVEQAYKQAVKDLGRKELAANTVAGKLVRRDYLQAKAADEVFAIGEMISPGQKDKKGYINKTEQVIVSGGTGYAVQMAFNLGKKVHVFDQNDGKWYYANLQPTGIQWVKEDTPELSKKFAGIGTRELKESGKQAINDVFTKNKVRPIAIEQVEIPTAEDKINIYAGTGENAELSNFAARPFRLGDDVIYPTVEHAFQLEKLQYSTAYTDAQKEAIVADMITKSASVVKSFGKTIKGVRIKEWDKDASITMKQLLLNSFEQNPEALQILLSTGNATLTHTQDKSKWGTEFPKLLMEVRSELRPQIETTTETTVKEGVSVDNLTPEQRVKYYKQFGIRKENGEYITLEDVQGNPEYYQRVAETGIVASEQTIREVAERMADRIGYRVRFESDRTADYKGKLDGNTAYVNLAHATLDTPIHEILGHPIIRAIKQLEYGKSINKKYISEEEFKAATDGVEMHGDYEWFIGKKKYIIEDSDGDFQYTVSDLKENTLYNNLLKELEYGKGKEVLGRVKRDYNLKNKPEIIELESITGIGFDFEVNGKSFSTKREAVKEQEKATTYYSLEEQQEEALVELLGLMTAEKLDAVKDGKLISLLKRLLKEINSFIRSLLKEREIEIAKLPDNMTLGDLANVLAYSNSKLILPGYAVDYVTPDNYKFKTYLEASLHISELTKDAKDVNLSNVSVKKELTNDDLQRIEELTTANKELNDYLKSDEYKREKAASIAAYTSEVAAIKNKEVVFYDQEPNLKSEDIAKYLFKDYSYVRVESTYSRGNKSFKDILGEDYVGYYIHGYNTDKTKPHTKILPITKEQAEEIWEKDASHKLTIDDRMRLNNLNDMLLAVRLDYDIKRKISDTLRKIDFIKSGGNIRSFIEKNKEYEQAKEVIEEWKKVNDIQYNPEEIYSRGQEFVSVVGAYSSFDVQLMMQNLLAHIEDNEKAGGKFAVSAFTKPVGKTLGHLEGGGGKIKFKIYPKSEDILWACNKDIYSGSVWDASEKINKDKKSELLGVSYTKYPGIDNVTEVKPNLASIVDELAHHHNELGITLTGNNFRLEYDEDIPYQTKKIINGINAVLDQKYGKIVKPEINKVKDRIQEVTAESFEEQLELENTGWVRIGTSEEGFPLYRKENKSNLPIQPTQTDDNLKESINSVKRKVITPTVSGFKIQNAGENWVVEYLKDGSGDIDFFDTKEEAEEFVERLQSNEQNAKEYTSQALINTKIAKLKEAAKKYPRTLIRSQVYRIGIGTRFDSDEELMFQKVSGLTPKQQLQQKLSEVKPQSREARDNALIDLQLAILRDVNTVSDIITPGGFSYLESIAKAVNNKRGIGKTPNRHVFDLFTMDEAAIRNTTGIALKGIAANNTSHAALRQHYDLQLSKPLLFDKKEFTSLSGKKASTQVTISEDGKKVTVVTGDKVERTTSQNFGEISAAVVDNAKNPVAAFINYTLQTSEMFSLLVGGGLDPHTASFFVSQPIVLHAIQLAEKQGKPLHVIMRGLLKENGIGMRDLAAVNMSTQELYDALGTSDITTGLQISVLKSYVAYSKSASDLGKLIRACLADTKGLQATIAYGEVLLNNIEQVTTDPRFSINGAGEMLTVTGKHDLIAHFTGYGVSKPMFEVLNQAFPYTSYLFDGIKREINDNLYNRNLTEKERNFINKQIVNYLTSDFDYFKVPERRDFIYDFPGEVLKLQQLSTTNPEVNTLAGKLLSILGVKNGEKAYGVNMNTIEINTIGKLTDEQIDGIKRTWLDLFELTEDTEGLRTFAHNLVRYAYHTKGLSFALGGMGHLIPAEAFIKHIVNSRGHNLSVHLETAAESAKNASSYNEIAKSQFIDQFYRHNYDSKSKFVPKVITTKAAMNFSTISEAKITINPATVKFDNLFTTRYERQGGESIAFYYPKPFIIHRGKLYKATTVETTGIIEYVRTFKLGISNFMNEYTILNPVTRSYYNPNNVSTEVYAVLAAAQKKVETNDSVIPSDQQAEDNRRECNQ